MDNQSIDEQFDELWSAALEQSYQIEVPDPGPSWKIISQRLDNRRKRKARLKRVWRTGAVAAAFLIGALLFSEPMQTKAYLPIMKIVKDVGGGISNIFYGDTKDDPKKALTSAPPDIVEPIQSGRPPSINEGTVSSGGAVFDSVEEAQKSVPFQIILPDYLPDGYALVNVTLAQSNVIATIFKDEKGKNIFVTQIRLGESDRLGYVSTEESSKSVTVNGIDRYFYFGTNFASIKWVQNNFSFVIQGDLPEEELISIAKSTH